MNVSRLSLAIRGQSLPVLTIQQVVQKAPAVMRGSNRRQIVDIESNAIEYCTFDFYFDRCLDVSAALKQMQPIVSRIVFLRHPGLTIRLGIPCDIKNYELLSLPLHILKDVLLDNVSLWFDVYFVDAEDGIGADSPPLGAPEGTQWFGGSFDSVRWLSPHVAHELVQGINSDLMTEEVRCCKVLAGGDILMCVSRRSNRSIELRFEDVAHLDGNQSKLNIIFMHAVNIGEK